MSEAGAGGGLREDPDAGRGWGAAGARLLVALLVLGAAYVGAALWLKERPPAGLTVAGVDIGTLSREQAERTLADELRPRTTEPLAVALSTAEGTEDDADLELVPERAGLALDLDATLEGVSGLSFDPRVLWARVAGQSRELPLVGTVDRPALEAELTRLAKDYDRAPVDGEVSLGPEGVEVTDAVEGRTLDVSATADAVQQAWEDQEWEEGEDRRAVAGTATAVAPALTAAEVERFTTEELEPALAAPVEVKATRGKGKGARSATAEIAPRELRELLDVEVGTDHRLSLALDEEALLARVRQDLGRLEAGPRDATVRLEGGEVEVVPAAVGYAVADDGVVDGVRAALGATGDGRAVTAEVRTVEPQIPTSASKEWSFSPMASFSSVFPTYAGTEARTENLRAGVSNVNGTVVMPGEQFSLSAALGEISPENGYVEAPVIVEGRLVKGIGGGLSQISTVVFNTSWSAGVQLDAHTPHSFYISRYPAGREATLAVPHIDNTWTNDTDNPVVVQTWIEGDTIQMTFLGERQYDVQTWDGERRNIVPGSQSQDDSPDCVPQHREDGFTITNVRILLQDGAEVGRDEFTTTYQPSDEITCTNPAAQQR